MKWRPIKTSPKDGTMYLASDGMEVVVRNQPDAFHGAGQWHWDPFEGTWMGQSNDFIATHWQPLPKAPTSRKAYLKARKIAGQA